MRITTEAKAAMRLKIVETARQLFAERGFEQTTTRDIAQAAEIATGTLFNYFPTKDAIVHELVDVALRTAEAKFAARESASRELIHARDEPDTSLDEDLFAFAAAGLRTLKPLRSYLSALWQTAFSPLAAGSAATDGDAESFCARHLQQVSTLLMRHGLSADIAPNVLQLYWALYTGVLVFWTSDKSPKQEDTLALLDQSMRMFAGWLISERPPSRRKKSPASVV